MRAIIPQAPLPVAWDGRAVAWDPWEAPQPVTICPPPKQERCSCGSESDPFTSRGRRDPSQERLEAAEHMPRLHTRGRALVWSVYDLFAYRCPDCGEVTVWDMASDRHWTLDESDLGPTGSWAWSGGLLDALLTESTDLSPVLHPDPPTPTEQEPSRG